MFYQIDLQQSYNKLLEASKELDHCEEMNLVKKIRTVSFSLYALESNHNDLIRYIQPTLNQPNLPLVAFKTVNLQLDTARKEVGRLLSNFSAAIMALVDCARRLYNSLYRDNNLFPDYNERVKEVFGNDLLHGFLQELRNYFIHYEVPQGLVKLSKPNPAKQEFKVATVLSISTLRNSGWDWNNKAKQFFNECIEDDLDIVSLTTQYRDKAVTFYNWFNERCLEIHKVELARLTQKQQRFQLIELEHRVNICLMSHAGQQPLTEAQIFTNFLSITDLEHLDQMIISNKTTNFSSERFAIFQVEHFDYIISIVEKSITLPPTLKSKIRSLYI